MEGTRVVRGRGVCGRAGSGGGREARSAPLPMSAAMAIACRTRHWSELMRSRP